MGLKKMVLSIIVCYMLLFLSGCQSGKVAEPVVTIPRYEKMNYETVAVNRQDVTPEVTLEVRIGDYKTYDYMAESSDLKLDSLKVSVGDKVKKGDILITFHSDELSEKLNEYEKEWNSNQLRLKHLNNLTAIEKEEDYNKEIKELKEDMSVLALRIQEVKEELANYSIVAKADGTITFVNEELTYGYVNTDSPLLVETCGSDEYEALCEEECNFLQGDIVSAELGIASYKMKVTSVSKKKEEVRVRFLPMEDMSGVSTSETLTMRVKQKTLKQVITVPVQAIFTRGEQSFVKIQDDKGFLDVREVVVGSEVPGTEPACYVIEEGLLGGEQVVVP